MISIQILITLYFFLSLTGLISPKSVNMDPIKEGTWLISKVRNPSRIIRVNVPYDDATNECKRINDFKGYYLEDDSICLQTTGVDLGETGFIGKWRPSSEMPKNISKLSGVSYNDCDSYMAMPYGLFGFSQIMNRTTPLYLTKSSVERMEKASVRKGFMGFVYATDLMVCLNSPVLETSLSVFGEIPVCSGGIVKASNSSCSVIIGSDSFHHPSCSFVKLPFYDEFIRVEQDGQVYNISCTPVDHCSLFDQMSLIIKIKNYECADNLHKFFFYMAFLGLVIFISLIFTFVKVLCLVKPLLKLLGCLLVCIAKRMRKQPKLEYIEYDLGEVRIVEDETTGFSVIEDSIAPNSNYRKGEKARFYTDGSILLPAIILFFSILLTPGLACQDMLSSVSKVALCTDGSCSFRTKMSLTIFTTPQDLCFSTSKDNYRVRFISSRISCLSFPEYFTNSYSKETILDSNTWWETKECSGNSTDSPWPKPDYLYLDYCRKEYFFWAMPPGHYQLWKRIRFTPTSQIPCSSEKCHSLLPEIRYVLYRNNVEVAQDTVSLIGKANSYVNVSVSDYRGGHAPRRFIRCGDQLFEQNLNDLGSFNEEIFGHIQCSSKEDARVLSKNCVTKVKGGGSIDYKEPDGIEKVNSLEGRFAISGAVPEKMGYSIDSVEMFPISLDISIKEPLRDVKVYREQLNSTKCSIIGQERKVNGAILTLEVKNKITVSDVVQCNFISPCRVIFDRSKKASCTTIAFSNTASNNRVICTLMYTQASIECSYDVKEYHIALIAPTLSFNSLSDIKDSSFNWLVFLGDMVQENPKTFLFVSVIPLSLAYKTMKETIRNFSDN
uniref:PC2 n=1 Tax=European wheat striate mosaic virus TaxID=2661631 RepID=A0A5P9K5N7_9VIRU|nr:pC2 [European wheat striate mosaic virus]